LAFPDDFVWPGRIPSLQQYFLPEMEKTPATVPLMDGGVADNVGLSSLIQAIPTGQDDLDLIIASDVDPKPIDLYQDFPLKPEAVSFLQRESRIGMTMGTLNYLLMAALAFLALTMVGHGISIWREMSGGAFRLSGLFFSLVTILLAAVVAGEIVWIRRLFRSSLLDCLMEKWGRGTAFLGRLSTPHRGPGHQYGQTAHLFPVRHDQ